MAFIATVRGASYAGVWAARWTPALNVIKIAAVGYEVIARLAIRNSGAA
jgi:hypothetical protein